MSTTAFTIPSAEEVAEHVPAFERSTAIFLSGSLVAGFGHANSGGDLVDAWQQRLAASRFGDILVSRYLEAADGFAEDALGLLDVGDVHTAAYCARLAYELGTQAMLAHSGRYCPGSKWRIAQLRR